VKITKPGDAGNYVPRCRNGEQCKQPKPFEPPKNRESKPAISDSPNYPNDFDMNGSAQPFSKRPVAEHTVVEDYKGGRYPPTYPPTYSLPPKSSNVQLDEPCEPALDVSL